MRNAFTFNGISSADLKLAIQKLPARPVPKQRQQTYVVPGRSGSLHVTDGAFDSVVLSIDCVVTDLSLIPAICQALQGSGKLWHSGLNITSTSQGNYFYQATVINTSDLVRMSSKWRSFQVQFECQPFIYYPTYTVTHDNHNSGFESHIGTAFARPKIVVYGNGNLSFTISRQEVSGSTTTVTYTVNNVSSYVTIDAETLTVYKGSTNKLPDFSSTDGDFPLLSPYLNVFPFLPQSTTKIEITPNWRFL
ncbi:MAG TPA: hypothetical protein PLD68_09770 [Clostridiales bacterium]|nr:hypothetical protein [Clostridiales bacterium]